MYYKVTYLYRRDDTFRRIADMWRELDTRQKTELADAFENILNRPVAMSQEVDAGHDPSDIGAVL